MATYQDGAMENFYDLPLEEKIRSLQQRRAKLIAKRNFIDASIKNIEKHIEMLENDGKK